MNEDTNATVANAVQIQKELYERLFPSLYANKEKKVAAFYDSLPPDAWRSDDNREITNYENIRGE